jgi:hypothetical protein
MPNNQSPGAAALTYPGRGLPVVACHWPAPADLPQFCSCGSLDCPAPARHPIGTLTIEDVAADVRQVSRWWLAHPTANLAMVTSGRVGVVALHHSARPDHIIRLLNTRQADPGPIIHAGEGLLHLLVKPDQRLDVPTTEAIPLASSAGSEAVAIPLGTPILLPPSRLMTGTRIRWIRRLYHTSRLPDAASLLGVLNDLLETGMLDELHPLPAPIGPPAPRIHGTTLGGRPHRCRPVSCTSGGARGPVVGQVP